MAKKKNDYGKDKGSLFDKKPDITTEQAEQTLYGKIHIPEKRIVGKPIALERIYPDARQPRRAIPAAVRAAAPGADTLTLLNRWRELAGEAQGHAIDPVPHITGKVQHGDDELAPITERLFDLYSLAASILSDGLMYPITVAMQAGDHLIETGERRYLAFTLLAEHVDPDEYGKIPAQVMDEHSVWRQAQENNNRAELNAIEKARQLAILYMDMWADDRDFGSIDELITPAGSDRPYYAQAADLNARRGYGQRVMDAMGVSQRGSISMYKKMLELTDEEWMEGDANDTPLKELLRAVDKREGTNYGAKSSNVYRGKHNETPTPPRSMSQTAGDTPPVPESHNTPPHSSTLAPDDRRDIPSGDDDRERPTPPEHTRNGFAVGDRVYHDRHNLARIERVEDEVFVAIRTEDTNSLIRHIYQAELTPAVEDDPQQQQSRDERDTEPPATHDIPYSMGQYVSLDQNPQRIGKVVQIRADQGVVVARMEDNGEILPALVNGWNPASAPPPAPAAAINDLPPDVYEPLTDGVAIIEKLADIYEAKAPEDDITDVRDALQLVRTGTLEEMHSRTPEELEQQFSLLVDMLHHMTDIFHDGLMKALIDLNGRRNS